MYKMYCRVYQTSLKIVSRFSPWRAPILLEGEDSIIKLPEVIQENNINRVLIVTDKVIMSLGLLKSLLVALDEKKIKYAIYDQTVPNPTIENIEDGLKLYMNSNCQGIIAFGGGSSIDCGKGIGARIARPKKLIPQMKGIQKVRRSIPPFFAVPTTSGTGSETTLAAVITDTRTKEKYAINDIALIPHYAVLDPKLTIGLPPNITSTTGMDALTHAIEAYIGKSNSKETFELSEKAVKLIFENLIIAYSDGNNIKARSNVQKGSYYAGAAFTKAYVGYVHGLAHALSAYYGLPHGLANAVILPYVLEYYGSSVYKPLAQLWDIISESKDATSNEIKAKQFINKIKEMNHLMKIPTHFDCISTQDIPNLVSHCIKESNPLYPVPRILDEKDLTILYLQIRSGYEN